MSIGISQRQMERAVTELNKCVAFNIYYILYIAFLLFRLDQVVQRTKKENAKKLEEEYRNMVEGLRRYF